MYIYVYVHIHTYACTNIRTYTRTYMCMYIIYVLHFFTRETFNNACNNTREQIFATCCRSFRIAKVLRWKGKKDEENGNCKTRECTPFWYVCRVPAYKNYIYIYIFINIWNILPFLVIKKLFAESHTRDRATFRRRISLRETVSLKISRKS